MHARRKDRWGGEKKGGPTNEHQHTLQNGGSDCEIPSKSHGGEDEGEGGEDEAGGGEDEAAQGD